MSNADTLRRIFALMDEKDFPSIRKLLAPEFSAVFGDNPPMGVKEWAGKGQMMYGAFPDGKHTFDETYEIGDRPVHTPGRRVLRPRPGRRCGVRRSSLHTEWLDETPSDRNVVSCAAKAAELRVVLKRHS